MSELTRKIALLDLDAFFASAEALRDPSLHNRPFAVGGGGARGVVATCNYAARKFGVRSAMSGQHALRLCPQLHFVSPDHAYYRQLSRQIFEILKQTTDLVEPASIDEFYLDLTHVSAYQGSATRIMEAIRSDIRALGVTASAGISNQKMVAKIASDERKPDGQFVVPPDQVYGFIAKLPLARIPGVGPKSQQRLLDAGFRTGKDVQQTDIELVQQVLGEKSGWLLYQRCHGRDPRDVVTERIRKSVGVEETLNQDVNQLRQVELFIDQVLLPQLKKRLKIDRWQDLHIKNQTVKLKFSDFQQTTVSRVKSSPSPSLFYQLVREAWERRNGRSVRLIGLSIALPDPDDQLQLELELE